MRNECFKFTQKFEGMQETPESADCLMKTT